MGSNGVPLRHQTRPVKLLLTNYQCPGDNLVMSAAIESLHVQFPGEYLTGVECTCPEIFWHNPRITPLQRHEASYCEMQYPLINTCSKAPVHFMNGFVDYLADYLKVPLKLQVSKPSLYLSEEERKNPLRPGKYWLVNAGVKQDFTAKAWGSSRYQEVVDALPEITFLQVGNRDHLHKPLSGPNVENWIGRTNIRELIRLCYHAQGGLGPSTFTQHVFAAFSKPYVCIAGGREPKAWLDYPTQRTLSNQGSLFCCQERGCWRSRVVPLADNDTAKNAALCLLPVVREPGEEVGYCFEMIPSDEAIRAILDYYKGGIISP